MASATAPSEVDIHTAVRSLLGLAAPVPKPSMAAPASADKDKKDLLKEITGAIKAAAPTVAVGKPQQPVSDKLATSLAKSMDVLNKNLSRFSLSMGKTAMADKATAALAKNMEVLNRTLARPDLRTVSRGGDRVPLVPREVIRDSRFRVRDARGRFSHQAEDGYLDEGVPSVFARMAQKRGVAGYVGSALGYGVNPVDRFAARRFSSAVDYVDKAVARRSAIKAAAASPAASSMYDAATGGAVGAIAGTAASRYAPMLGRVAIGARVVAGAAALPATAAIAAGSAAYGAYSAHRRGGSALGGAIDGLTMGATNYGGDRTLNEAVAEAERVVATNDPVAVASALSQAEQQAAELAPYALGNPAVEKMLADTKAKIAVLKRKRTSTVGRGGMARNPALSTGTGAMGRGSTIIMQQPMPSLAGGGAIPTFSGGGGGGSMRSPAPTSSGGSSSPQIGSERGPTGAGTPEDIKKAETFVTGMNPNVRKAISEIGIRETSFTAKEALTDANNQPESNRNVGNAVASGMSISDAKAKYGDYGYYQLNQADVDRGIEAGMAPSMAAALNDGGGKGGYSVAQQTAATAEYMRLVKPEAYAAAEKGDRSAFYEAAKGQWPSLPGGGSYKTYFDDVASKIHGGELPGAIANIGKQATSSSGVTWDGSFGASTGPEAAEAAGVERAWNYFKDAPPSLTKLQAGESKFDVRSDVAGNFQQVLDELEATGYKFSNKGGAGGYANRSTASGGHSQHASGNAIDVNPAENPHDHSGRNTMPTHIGPAAAKAGITWGGFMSKPDSMHFEYNAAHGVKPMTLEQYKEKKAAADKARMEAAASAVSTPAVPEAPIAKGATSQAEAATAGAASRTMKERSEFMFGPSGAARMPGPSDDSSPAAAKRFSPSGTAVPSTSSEAKSDFKFSPSGTSTWTPTPPASASAPAASASGSPASAPAASGGDDVATGSQQPVPNVPVPAPDTAPQAPVTAPQASNDVNMDSISGNNSSIDYAGIAASTIV